MPKVTVNVGPSAGLSDPAGTTWTGEVRSAPSGTSAVRDVADATLTVGDGRPAKSTSGAPWNPVPVSVTVVVPLVPDVGLSFVIVGSTTRSGGLAFVPPGVATVSGPVVAVAGIEPIVIFVVPVTLNGSATVPTLTEVTPTNVVPVMSNGAEPVCAWVVVSGSSAGGTLNARLAAPPSVVTVSGPDVAVVGTDVWSSVELLVPGSAACAGTPLTLIVAKCPTLPRPEPRMTSAVPAAPVAAVRF